MAATDRPLLVADDIAWHLCPSSATIEWYRHDRNVSGRACVRDSAAVWGATLPR